MARKRVGITGAAGRMGAVLARGLEADYDLTLYGRRTRASGLRYVRLQVASEVRGQFDGLDALFHMAADPSPWSSWASVRDHNISATYNVLEECRRAGVERVIFASTNHTMHGNAILTTEETLDPSKRLSMKGDDPPNPDSLYAVSKLFGENLGKLYSERHGLRFLAARIGWLTGEDEPGRMKGTKSADYMRAVYLSHRDWVAFSRRALEVDFGPFFVAYVTSANTRNIYDLSQTRRVLGYEPQDNAEPAFA